MNSDATPDIPTGATQLADVLDLAEETGYTTEFDVAAGDSAHDILRCQNCDVESPASSFERAWSQRLEGASDPADMLHVSALTCPSCGARGVFVSPYGPTASDRQASVLRALPEAERESPPSPS